MKNLNENIKKVCSFYVSDWHLAVMVLPHINKEIEKGKQVITYLETNIEENISTLLSKLNLSEKSQQNINKINWKSKTLLKYTDIENELNESKGETIILASGKREYIDKVNQNIEKYKENSKRQNIKIINCYEVGSFSEDIKDILDGHDRILNTAGEKHIEDVFKDYTKYQKQA